MKWHQQPVDLVLEELNTSANGLDEEESVKRLEKYGCNELMADKKATPFQLFFKQFADVMILVLLAAAAISFFLKEYPDAVVVLVIVFLNAITGFVQEFRAEKAMALLKEMANPVSLVVRKGVAHKINSSDLVPGDVIILEAGTKVPADIRLIESHSLKIDESSLTGESIPSDKVTAELKQDNLNLGDYSNMAFNGTYITYGRGKGVITATGMNTELGRIAEMLQEASPPTPLQVRMKDFSRKLTFIVIAICVVLFLIGFLQGNSAAGMLLLSLSVAVAAIPEALPAVITISLAMGAKRLVNRNALVRKLYAVETLGSVSFICSDKTGTLTQNKMQVSEIWVPENKTHPVSLVQAMHLNQDVEQRANALLGDPTEVALLLYLHQHKVYDQEWIKEHERVDEIPFDPERKVMTTIHKDNGGPLIITKGAVESIAAICPGITDDEELARHVDEMTSRGLRVMAYAYNQVDELPLEISSSTVEKEMKFLGLAGLIDPPREEAKQAIQECKAAGIVPVMITGDHPSTAEYIARELEILSNETDLLVTGVAMEQMPDTELEDKIEQIKVYARVSPAQKLRIVSALQKKGHFVAMTGDGVNDAPSIKMANIGVAMGITGTDVTKEAAQMILLDDNFATIVKAVKQGRRIFENIRKFIHFIMAGNTAELVAVLIAPLMGLPLPLLPVQILWINLVTDGLPALALVAEPSEKDIMKKPPRKANANIFSDNLGNKILAMGFFMGILTLTSQLILVNEGIEHWQTMIFTILCFSQLWHVLAIRSETKTLFKLGIFTNIYLLAAVIFTVGLQLLIIYTPAIGLFFHTSPLSFKEIMFSVFISSLVFVVLELSKVMIKKRSE